MEYYSANHVDRNADICNDMDLKHLILSKSQTKKVSLYNSISMKCPERKIYEDKN